MLGWCLWLIEVDKIILKQKYYFSDGVNFYLHFDGLVTLDVEMETMWVEGQSY